jgi:hypothetical protein
MHMVRRLTVVLGLLAIAGAVGATEITYSDATGAQRRAAVTNSRLLVDTAGPTKFTCSLAALVASLTECQAAPAAGLRYYITDIVVQTTTATAGDYSIQSGTGTNCGTATAAVFPKHATTARFKAPIAANPTAVINFTTPIAVTTAHALCVIGHGTNTINVQISGFVAP